MAREPFPPAWLRERCFGLRQRGVAAFQRVWGAAAPTGSRGLRVVKDIGKKTFERLYATPWQALARRHWKLLLVIGAVIMVGIIWKVPQWQAAGWQGQMEPKDLAKLQNDTRTTLVQTVGGAVLLIGLYLTFRNLQLTQDRQITEHYTRAVEQLGSDRLTVRLGAIYALERIARDSARDHWPIMEILTGYIRERSPWVPKQEQPLEKKQETENDEPPPRLAADIQAVLSVFGRRNRTFEQWTHYRSLQGLDLRGADLQNLHYLSLEGLDLRGADLQNLHLERTNLVNTHLEGAMLANVHLEHSILAGTHLEGVLLIGAHLEGATLFSANLKGCWFQRTNFRDAELERAYFEGAHLKGACNITLDQLAFAKTLYNADLDPPLLEQVRQLYPHLLEEPKD